MKVKHRKLVIGSAQWGMDYGISNSKGKTDIDEIAKILSTANKHGINTLDTASAYGDAEKIIGKLSKGNNEIITKIGIGNKNQNSKQLRCDIQNKINKSYTDLGGKILEGVLIHDPDNLEYCKHSYKWDALKDMKEEGYMKKIGISAYDPSQAEKLVQIYKPDIIQIPFNAFDREAANLGTLKRLKEDGVEIHARSIFLQGLLLMEIKDISNYFDPWMPKIKEWHKYCLNNRLTLLEGAITNAMGEENIDKYIVGIENTRQLEQIIDATKRTVRDNFESSNSGSDEGLINPSKWKAG